MIIINSVKEIHKFDAIIYFPDNSEFVYGKTFNPRLDVTINSEHHSINIKTKFDFKTSYDGIPYEVTDIEPRYISVADLYSRIDTIKHLRALINSKVYLFHQVSNKSYYLIDIDILEIREQLDRGEAFLVNIKRDISEYVISDNSVYSVTLRLTKEFIDKFKEQTYTYTKAINSIYKDYIDRAIENDARLLKMEEERRKREEEEKLERIKREREEERLRKEREQLLKEKKEERMREIARKKREDREKRKKVRRYKGAELRRRRKDISCIYDEYVYDVCEFEDKFDKLERDYEGWWNDYE